MPDTATAPTASAAQTRAAGSRMLGYYRGAGGVIVDCVHDVANFVTKGANDFFEAAGPNAALRVIPNASTQWGGFEIYTGGQHEGSFKSQGSTGETRISSGRSVGWGGHITLYTDTTEKVRIATNGNVGIGTAAPAEKLEIAGNISLSKGVDRIVRIGSESNFHYDLRTRLDDFRIVAADGTIALNILYPSYSVNPGRDNVASLGAAPARWSVGYAGSNWIITCDVRFKLFRIGRDITAAEHAAALECFDAFGFFQFLDAIALKGPDGARPHIGPGAQEVWSIFAAHGLVEALVENDKGELVPVDGSVPPACLCFDKIEEERAPVMEGWRPSLMLGPDGEPVMVKCAEGEEATEQRPTGETIVTREAGHIFGVRIDQLQSLMLIALNKERKTTAATVAAMEVRLAALEPAA